MAGPIHIPTAREAYAGWRAIRHPTDPHKRMVRIRTVKPELARHELLYELEISTGLPLRFAWVMLFTVCDREGRFKWRPRAMKPDILPHDDLDFARVLDAFHAGGLIVKYRVGEEWYGQVPTFRKHQTINNRESDSLLPSLDEAVEISDTSPATSTRAPRVNDASQGEREGKGREGR